MGRVDIVALEDFGKRLNKMVKQIVRDYVDNQNMSDTVYATWTGEGLKIDNKPVEIDKDFVEIPEHLKKYKVKVSFDLTQEELDNQVLIVKKSGEKVELSRLKFDKIPMEIEYDKMEAGQRYLVQQKQGAQTYVIIDRIPEDES